MKLNDFQLRVSNSKCNFLFFNLELVTQKRNKIFNYQVSNSKLLEVSNSKLQKSEEKVTRSKFFSFFDFELVTGSVNLNFLTSN